MMASFDSNPGNKNVEVSLMNQNVGSSMSLLFPAASTLGVLDCYVFKRWLQEYAQKVGLPTPVYETISEGPSHEPCVRSTVIVNSIRYDSLPGFLNRKAAEQSAAEVALMELSKISVTVNETGLCKTFLKHYADKMNYAIPTYECKIVEPGRTPLFSCTVEIGGIQYVGATAKTKKDAEIKAARTALLAIRSSCSVTGENDSSKSQYTVVPCKRKVSETCSPLGTVKPKKLKKPCFGKKMRKQTPLHTKSQAGNVGVLVDNNMSDEVAAEQIQHSLSNVQAPDIAATTTQCLASAAQENGSSNLNQSHEKASTGKDSSIPEVGVNHVAYRNLGVSNVHSMMNYQAVCERVGCCAFWASF